MYKEDEKKYKINIKKNIYKDGNFYEDNYNFDKGGPQKKRRFKIIKTIIGGVIIIGLISIGGFYIYKCISSYNGKIKNNVKIASNEIKTAPDLKKIELNGAYNNNLYAAIVIKGTSQVKGIVQNEISNLTFSGIGGFENINNKFSNESNLINELNNAVTMKMIKNFENYINNGNLKLDIPAIEKELGVKDENDIFVSAKIVKNIEPNLPNRNYYIDPKIAMFNGIKMPNYNGGYLEIVFLNKKDVVNFLNKANENQGSMQYKVANSNIDGFNILLAYIWMDNSYSPLYYTNTSLYSGNTGWTDINNYGNSNNEDEVNVPNSRENKSTENTDTSIESSMNNTNNSSSIDEEGSSSSSSNISETENTNTNSSASSDDDDVSCGGGDD